MTPKPPRPQQHTDHSHNNNMYLPPMRQIHFKLEKKHKLEFSLQFYFFSIPCVANFFTKLTQRCQWFFLNKPQFFTDHNVRLSQAPRCLFLQKMKRLRDEDGDVRLCHRVKLNVWARVVIRRTMAPGVSPDSSLSSDTGKQTSVFDPKKKGCKQNKEVPVVINTTFTS